MTDRPEDCGCQSTGLTREDLLRRTALAVGGAVLLGPAAAARAATGATDAAAVKRGGTLRVAFVGGGSAETLDPHRGSATVDIARSTVLYEKLFDQQFIGGTIQITPTLAESLEPANSKGDVWVLKIKKGVEWHDGKPFTIDDVVYTFRRILNKKNGLGGITDIDFVNPAGLRKIDDHTLRMTFLTPIAEPRHAFASRFQSIIQDGFTSFAKPVGTGPFTFKSWTPGQQSMFVKNPNYRVQGLPYIDELVYLDIPDQSARLSALRGGQVDAIESVDPAQAKALANDKSVQILNCHTGGMVPLVMSANLKPFDDARVRLAFRLLIDRKQMLSNVLNGFGIEGNDIFSPFDPLYAHDIPQRKYDPEKARSLLKAAGQEGLKMTLYSSTIAPGMLESAQVFAQQAKAGGVTISVDNGPAASYYTDHFGKVPLFQTQWGNFPLDSMYALSSTTKAIYNEAHYSNPKLDALWRKARATLDDATRKQRYHDVQELYYNDGAYAIWGHPNNIDGIRHNVRGLPCSPIRPLGFFDFKRVWLA
jgi:peptide/nickel transport system substrate-binding protein